jgi:hypothetical protein
MTGSTIVRPGAFHSPARKARLLLASLPVFAGLLSEDGTVLECNFGPLGGQLEGRTGWVGKPFETGPWWNYSGASRADIQTLLGRAQTGHPASQERLYQKSDGTMGVMVLSLTPLFTPYGTPDAILVTAVDVTERRREVDMAAHIAHDMAHRLRNSFTMMRVMATRSSDMMCSGEIVLSRRLSRIRDSQALSYRYLFFDVPTQDIVQAVLSDPAQLSEADYDPVSIPADYVEALMLAIGELAQSGHKATFMSQRVGDDQLSLLWSEESPREGQSVPAGLAKALLTVVPEQKTAGYVQMENTSTGFFWRFVFPLQHPDMSAELPR